MDAMKEMEKHYLIEQLKSVAIFTKHDGVKKIVDKAIEYINKQ